MRKHPAPVSLSSSPGVEIGKYVTTLASVAMAVNGGFCGGFVARCIDDDGLAVIDGKTGLGYSGLLTDVLVDSS